MATAVNLTRKRVLMDSGRIARSFLARGRGLLGHPPLRGGQGLALVPGSWIHTLFMPAAIDVLYLDREGRVVRMSREMPPWRIGPWVRRARWVLELPPGTIRRTGTEVGDRVELRA